jgi:hypothetical protein
MVDLPAQAFQEILKLQPADAGCGKRARLAGSSHAWPDLHTIFRDAL